MIMRDSANPNSIPAGTPMVAGYVDGIYGPGTNYWNAAAWARWTAAGARLRRIAAVTVNTPSDTADVERYDLSPADAPVWWHNMTSRGETDLWVYVNRDNQRAVEDALWAGGVPLDGCSMWIATLDGTQHVSQYRYPIAAVQYVDTGPYDESIVYEAFGQSGGSITTGGFMAALTDDQQQQLYQVAGHMYQVVGELYYALGIKGGPSDVAGAPATDAHSTVLDDLKARVAALEAPAGGTAGPPTQTS